MKVIDNIHVLMRVLWNFRVSLLQLQRNLLRLTPVDADFMFIAIGRGALVITAIEAYFRGQMLGNHNQDMH